MHTVPVARRGCPAGGPVVAADGKQPVLVRRVLFAQDFRSYGEVAVWVQQLAGLRVATRVVAEIDLAEAGVDAIGLAFARSFASSGTTIFRGVYS